MSAKKERPDFSAGTMIAMEAVNFLFGFTAFTVFCFLVKPNLQVAIIFAIAYVVLSRTGLSLYRDYYDNQDRAGAYVELAYLETEEKGSIHIISGKELDDSFMLRAFVMRELQADERLYFEVLEKTPNKDIVVRRKTKEE